MIELHPIPVNGLVSNKNKTISPNTHYAAYATNNGRQLHIINLKDKDNLCISEQDFEYNFACMFSKPIKVHQITFNNNSDRLYCLTKKSQYTKLYQFKNFQNSDLPISKQWRKHEKTYLPFDVTSFTINEETQELNLVGFTNKQVTYKVLKMQTQELINKNVEPVYSNITKIKLDQNNMKLSVLSENKELNIFTETNNDWKVKNTLYDCNDIPVSNQDGNILVDEKFKGLEIRSLLEPHYGKVVYKIKLKFPILDFSINSAGNKIKVFTQNLKNNINYSTFYTDGNPSLWTETDCEPELIMQLYNNRMTANYTNKICSLFTDDNKLAILFNPYFNSYNIRGKAKNIRIITKQTRIASRQQNRPSRHQSFSSSNRSTNYRSNRYNEDSSFALTSFALAATTSSNYGYSCNSNGGGGGSCDGGGGGGSCDGGGGGGSCDGGGC